MYCIIYHNYTNCIYLCRFNKNLVKISYVKMPFWGKNFKKDKISVDKYLKNILQYILSMVADFIKREMYSAAKICYINIIPHFS